MRTAVLVLALVACDKGKPAASGSGSQVVVATDAAVVATDAAVVAIDAATAGPAPIDDDKFLETETIGALKLRMNEAGVKAALGAPKSKSKPIEEGATGNWVSDWSWPGVRLKMASPKKAGPFVIDAIEITAPSTLATSRGIKIGSTRNEVAKAYPKSDEETNDPKKQFLVGSVYGGLLFELDNDKVANMFLGAMAF